MTSFIGVDPGASGGVAAIVDGEAIAWKMPPTEKNIHDLFLELPRPAFALIERSQAYPKMGVSGAFNYGANYGFLRAMLITCGIPFEEVSPAKWQKVMRCLTHGDKTISKSKAQQLFPKLKVTHATADALLIACYAQRTYGVTSKEQSQSPSLFKDF
jgi:crossover junction endodeoxyribonuclease RuvC